MNATPIDMEKSTFPLSRLFSTLLKRLPILLGLSLAGFAGGFIYSYASVSPQYQASGTLTFKTSVNTTVLTTITQMVESQNVAHLVYEDLDSRDIFHYDGTEISEAEIFAGIASTSSSTSYNISVVFSSSDSSIAVAVLNSILDTSVTYGNATFGYLGSNLLVLNYAASFSATGHSHLFNAMIGFLLMLFISSIGISFVDVYFDQIKTADDLKNMGALTGEYTLKIHTANPIHIWNDFSEAQRKLLVQSMFPFEKGTQQYENMLRIQNTVDSFDSLANLQITILSSHGDFPETSLFAINYAKTFSYNNQKTLLIDLNFHNPRIEKHFFPISSGNVFDSILRTQQNKKQFLKVNDFLSILPPPETAYPSAYIKSSAFSQIIENAKRDFDKVIIFAPTFKGETNVLSCAKYSDTIVSIIPSATMSRQRFLLDYNSLVASGYKAVYNVVILPKFFL